MALPDADRRGCYCGLWETSPATLKKEGLPRGYCGFCRVCGQAGHLRHFPGSLPLTAAWCDRHYRVTLLLHPRGSIGCLLWLGVVGLLVYAGAALLS